jgi:enoyl-CoA hydratase
VTLVVASVEAGVGRVHLNDADHRNVLTKAMSDAIAAAVAEVLAADVGAIVLTAAAPVFCAGGSLDSLVTREHPLSAAYAGQDALGSAPVPTIAAVAGPAIGAGCNLPLACDVILVTPDARFDPRFLDVGIHPGGGHLWRMRQRVGDQGAVAMTLCGDILSGAEAVAAGLAWRCVASEDLDAAATELATRAAARSRPLLLRAKESLRASAAMPDVASAAQLELDAQIWSVEQPEFRLAIDRVKSGLAARKRPT